MKVVINLNRRLCLLKLSLIAFEKWWNTKVMLKVQSFMSSLLICKPISMSDCQSRIATGFVIHEKKSCNETCKDSNLKDGAHVIVRLWHSHC